MSAKNRGISTAGGIFLVLITLIVTSGAIAFEAISVGGNTSTSPLTVTVVNTTTSTSAMSANNDSVHVTGILVAYTAPFIASYNLTHGGINTTVDDYNIVVLRNETGGTSGHGEYIGFVTTSTDTGSNVRRSTMVLTYIGTVGNSQSGIFSAIGTMTYTYSSANRSIAVSGKVTVVQGSGQGGLAGICGEETVQGVLGPPFTFADSYYFGASCSSISSTGSSVTIPNLFQNQTTTTSGSEGAAFQIVLPSGAGSSQSLSFSPENVTLVIGVNNTVTWTNDDNAAHTVTSTSVPSGASGFNSNNLNPGAEFTYTFTVPGTYTYHCSYHPWMKGTIIVKSG
jgi:plastocyanin